MVVIMLMRSNLVASMIEIMVADLKLGCIDCCDDVAVLKLDCIDGCDDVAALKLGCIDGL